MHPLQAVRRVDLDRQAVYGRERVCTADALRLAHKSLQDKPPATR
jgi:hypothetical protein